MALEQADCVDSAPLRAAVGSLLRGRLLIGIAALTAAACIAVPAWQLLARGPFAWHIERPAFWQGGLEALALIGAMAVAQLLTSRAIRLGVSIVVGAIYLRRHGVDAAFVVDLLYLELCFALGAVAARRCGGAAAADIPAWLRQFVLGFLIWSACAWTLSAFGFGSEHDLRWLSALLLVAVSLARPRPWTAFVAGRIEAWPRAARAGAAVLVAWLLILYARSATVAGFDGLWYGFRGDRVLVGNGSVFAAQGLVAPVYYFPKIYELFLVPVSGLGSDSVIAGMTILITALLAAATWPLMAICGVRERAPRLVAALVVFTLPAVANSALDPKPDMLAALLLACAWLEAMRWIGATDRAAAIWTTALLLLAINVKLTAIPYAAALALTTSAAVFARRLGKDRGVIAATQAGAALPVALFALVLVVVVCAFATARTLLLAGVPTIGPDPLFKLWSLLGFDLKFPVGTLRWNWPHESSDDPMLALDLLFRPQFLEHIQISWTGNVWLWLAFFTAAATALHVGRAGAWRPARTAWPGVALVLVSVWLVFGWGFGVRGGDGNYFIAAVAGATVLTLAVAWRRARAEKTLGIVLLAAAIAFAAFDAAYAFASAGWISGTRALDLRFDLGPRESQRDNERLFRADGIAQIAGYLRALPNWPRVVGCTEAFNTLGDRLPARFEDAPSIVYARPDLADTVVHFRQFLSAAGIGFLVVPNATSGVDCADGRIAVDTASALRAQGVVPVISDARYDLYAITSAGDEERGATHAAD